IIEIRFAAALAMVDGYNTALQSLVSSYDIRGMVGSQMRSAYLGEYNNQSNDGGSPDPQSGGEKNPSDVHSGFPGDGRIHVTNEYKGDVYFKPEGDLNLNDFHFKNDGAYKMGTQSWIPLDGINVNGKVYKISDGYSNIRITETGEVKVLYLGLPGQLHYWFLGGEKSSPPDPSWNNLFNVNKR
ncbi:MAG TPA: hypothetical protein VLZ83_12430, partial [Edaphocola sp.]|nr:hypothetical protein [Edaphocola sp.]